MHTCRHPSGLASSSNSPAVSNEQVLTLREQHFHPSSSSMRMPMRMFSPAWIVAAPGRLHHFTAAAAAQVKHVADLMGKPLWNGGIKPGVQVPIFLLAKRRAV